MKNVCVVVSGGAVRELGRLPARQRLLEGE